jgi:hypothetical protein
MLFISSDVMSSSSIDLKATTIDLASNAIIVYLFFHRYSVPESKIPIKLSPVDILPFSPYIPT